MAEFPTDETTLQFLIASCKINPDSGRTHLHDFLEMGARVKSIEQVEWSDPEVFEVEHEEGFEPFSEHQVIETLAEELLKERQTTRYKVINKDSTHYGEIGVKLDKEAIRRNYGLQAGRSEKWYSHWDLLLGMNGDREMGTGFLESEVEAVP